MVLSRCFYVLFVDADSINHPTSQDVRENSLEILKGKVKESHFWSNYSYV